MARGGAPSAEKLASTGVHGILLRQDACVPGGEMAASWQRGGQNGRGGGSASQRAPGRPARGGARLQSGWSQRAALAVSVSAYHCTRTAHSDRRTTTAPRTLFLEVSKVIVLIHRLYRGRSSRSWCRRRRRSLCDGRSTRSCGGGRHGCVLRTLTRSAGPPAVAIHTLAVLHLLLRRRCARAC